MFLIPIESSNSRAAARGMFYIVTGVAGAQQYQSLTSFADSHSLGELQPGQVSLKCWKCSVLPNGLIQVGANAAPDKLSLLEALECAWGYEREYPFPIRKLKKEALLEEQRFVANQDFILMRATGMFKSGSTPQLIIAEGWRTATAEDLLLYNIRVRERQLLLQKEADAVLERLKAMGTSVEVWKQLGASFDSEHVRLALGFSIVEDERS